MQTATHPATFAEQAAYLARRLPPVILTTTDPTGRGRGQGSTRPLPPAPADAPTWTGSTVEAGRRFSILVIGGDPGARHLAFCGRCYSRAARPADHDDRVELHASRGIVGALARLFLDAGAVDTTAEEVRS